MYYIKLNISVSSKVAKAEKLELKDVQSTPARVVDWLQSRTGMSSEIGDYISGVLVDPEFSFMDSGVNEALKGAVPHFEISRL